MKKHTAGNAMLDEMKYAAMTPTLKARNRETMKRIVLGDYVSHCITPTAPQGTGWTLTWEFSNNHVRHQKFLTEAEALAFVERSIDSDPNVLSWVIIEDTGRSRVV